MKTGQHGTRWSDAKARASDHSKFRSVIITVCTLGGVRQSAHAIVLGDRRLDGQLRRIELRVFVPTVADEGGRAAAGLGVFGR